MMALEEKSESESEHLNLPSFETIFQLPAAVGMQSNQS